MARELSNKELAEARATAATMEPDRVDRILERVAVPEMPTGAELAAKKEAFASLAQLVRTGMWPGCKTVDDALVICWIADSLGIHPAVALQHVYRFTSGTGRSGMGFSWRLKWGLAQARIPGIEKQVVRQDAIECVVRGRRSPADAWETVSYTMEQARRQGLVTRNPLYTQDHEDMLFKQAMSRLVDRIAGDVMIGLATPELPSEMEPAFQEDAGERSEAQAADGEQRPMEDLTPSSDEAAPAAVAPNALDMLDNAEAWRGRIAEHVRAFYAPAKISQARLMNIVMEAHHRITGEQVHWRKLEDVDRDQAEAIQIFLEENMAGKPGAAPVVPIVARPQDDPDPRQPGEDAPPPIDKPSDAAPDRGFDRLMLTLKNVATKTRPFIRETRPGLRWVSDQELLEACGYQAPVMLLKDGVRMMAEEQCEAMADALIALKGDRA